MNKRTLLAFGVALLAASILPSTSFATLIYDYSGSTGSGFTLNILPTDVGDVGTLPTLPAGQFYSVTSIVVARFNGATAGSFDIGFFLWNSVDITSGTSIFSNLAASTSFNRSATGTTSVNTTSITFAAGALNLASGQTFGYQMVYAMPGTINLATAAYTPTNTGSSAFFVDHGPTSGTGSSPDTVYLDNDTNGKFTSADATSISGQPGFANVFLQINATIVPEPSTNAALGCGAVTLLAAWLIRRRRTA